MLAPSPPRPGLGFQSLHIPDEMQPPPWWQQLQLPGWPGGGLQHPAPHHRSPHPSPKDPRELSLRDVPRGASLLKGASSTLFAPCRCLWQDKKGFPGEKGLRRPRASKEQPGSSGQGGAGPCPGASWDSCPSRPPGAAKHSWPPAAALEAFQARGSRAQCPLS